MDIFDHVNLNLLFKEFFKYRHSLANDMKKTLKRLRISEQILQYQYICTRLQSWLIYTVVAYSCFEFLIET